MNEKIGKAPNEKFCYECGAVINMKAEICPKCGVRQIKLSSISANSIFGVIALSACLGLFSSVFIGWTDALLIMSNSDFMFIVSLAAICSIFSILSVAFNKSTYMWVVFLISMLVLSMVYSYYVDIKEKMWSSPENGLYIALASGILMFFCSFLSIISTVTKKA